MNKGTLSPLWAAIMRLKYTEDEIVDLFCRAAGTHELDISFEDGTIYSDGVFLSQVEIENLCGIVGNFA